MFLVLPLSYWAFPEKIRTPPCWGYPFFESSTPLDIHKFFLTPLDIREYFLSNTSWISDILNKGVRTFSGKAHLFLQNDNKKPSFITSILFLIIFVMNYSCVVILGLSLIRFLCIKFCNNLDWEGYHRIFSSIAVYTSEITYQRFIFNLDDWIKYQETNLYLLFM